LDSQSALEDRLWIQRIPPKPAKSLKRKRPVENRKLTPTEQHKQKASKKRRTDASIAQEDTSKRTRRGRAAKLQAKIKLDAQAKELAALQTQARNSRQATRSTRGTTKQPARPQGTRVSARLRGAQDDWQCVPAEWLNETLDVNHESGEDVKSTSARNMANGAQYDSVSELTELSDESDDSDIQTKIGKQDQFDRLIREDQAKSFTENFVEWETVSSFWVRQT